MNKIIWFVKPQNTSSPPKKGLNIHFLTSVARPNPDFLTLERYTNFEHGVSDEQRGILRSGDKEVTCYGFQEFFIIRQQVWGFIFDHPDLSSHSCGVIENIEFLENGHVKWKKNDVVALWVTSTICIVDFCFSKKRQ